MRYWIQTLGCKANFSDSQQVELQLRELGYLPAFKMEDAELLVVNSCTVTEEADRQSLLVAKQGKKKNPDIKVLMTGCGAEVDPKKYAESVGVDWVIGNQDKSSLGRLLKNVDQSGGILGKVTPYSVLTSSHPMDREWPEELSSVSIPLDGQAEVADRARAFLKIQDGCNAFCTYCIIPYGRGKSRSTPPKDVLEEVIRCEDAGIKEVILTGINLGHYGNETENWEKSQPLVQLLTTLVENTSSVRFRLGSLDPSEWSDLLIEFMYKYSHRLAPHFHLSLQSPVPRILKRMKRNYGETDIFRFFEKVSSLPWSAPPFIGVDLITGFPGETEEEFQQTLQKLNQWKWTRLHVFPYSERSGTPATKLPGTVPQEERKHRAALLRKMSLQRVQEHYHEILKGSAGLDLEVLFESAVKAPGKDLWMGGHTANYLRVQTGLNSEYLKKSAKVRIHSVVTDTARGECSFLGDLVGIAS